MCLSIRCFIGTRHSVGMQFHPVTNELWFTDNNPDRMGDNMPDGKLNRVTYPGEDFGFPYCHTGGMSFFFVLIDLFRIFYKLRLWGSVFTRCWRSWSVSYC